MSNMSPPPHRFRRFYAPQQFFYPMPFLAADSSSSSSSSSSNLAMAPLNRCSQELTPDGQALKWGRVARVGDPAAFD